MSILLTSPPAFGAGTCSDCAAGTDHCHETLVLHDDGHGECPDPACAGHWETHEFRLFCDERHERCIQCRPAPPVEPPRGAFVRRRLPLAA